MKLLLLLLPIYAFGFSMPDWNLNIFHTEPQKPRYGELSSEAKAKLKKAWGMDLDERKTRLDRIRKKFSKTVGKASSDLEERLKEIVPLNTTKPNENVTNLFEVNNRLGVSDYLFEGDILLSPAQLNEIEQELNGRTKRQAYSFATKWTASTLNFYFDPSINDRKKASVRAAHDLLQAHTCINFVEDATAANRVKVYNGAGCNAGIGMWGGEQLLSLGDGCEVIGTTAHEFAHSLGIMHTQSRSDRNTFVDVNTNDVNPNLRGNFAQQGPNENYLYTPYEYGSSMHYPPNAFTSRSDSFSIIPKDAKYMNTIGGTQITFYDMKMINYHYNCNVTCTAANSAVCQNGGYPNPRNCAECNCPQGYGGALCDERPTGCGESLQASAVWQKKEFTFGDQNNRNIRDVYTMCNHWITAPQGKKIQVRITKMVNEQCSYGCRQNGIEIKADARKEITNPRFCCTQFNNQIIESELSPTPIVSFNRFWYNTFGIEYRYVDPNGCISPLTFSQLPLLRLYNHGLQRHLFQFDRYETDLWMSSGYRIEGEIGKVIDTDAYTRHKAELDALCPHLVKLRTFYSSVGTEFMTIDDSQAQWRINNGWREARPAGYCSRHQACGANKNLRLVAAHDGGNMIFSTDSNELGTLNWQNPRYAGTLSNTICWLF